MKALLCILANLLLSLNVEAQLRVGFIGGFTGPGQMFGKAAQNGFELAQAELGSRAIDVYYEDDQFLPAHTVRAFHKLTSTTRVDLIIVLGSTNTAAIAPLAEKLGIPTIAWAGAEDVAKGRRWIVRSWASGADEGSALARKAIELGLSRVATLSYSDDYALSVVRGFSTHLPNKLHTLLSLGEIAASEHDFSTIALKVKQQKLDGVMVCLSVGQTANLARQLLNLKLSPVILGCETLNSSTEWRLAHGALERAWFATVSASADFAAKYRKAFGADTSIGGAAVHYELYKILHEISSSRLNKAEIIERLFTIRNRPSVVGEFSIVRRNDDQWFELPVTTHMVPTATGAH